MYFCYLFIVSLSKDSDTAVNKRTVSTSNFENSFYVFVVNQKIVKIDPHD